MSEQINELATALAAAQAEIEDAAKAKSNPAFRSKYCDLGAVVDACKPALVKHGLSFSQLFEPSAEGTLMLTTMLLHKSGQWLRGTCLMPLAKTDPQGYGSAATYARRYGLAAIVGVCPEDDDGNAASGHGHSNGYQQRQQPRDAAPESRGDQRAQRQAPPQAQKAVQSAERPLKVAGSEAPATEPPPAEGLFSPDAAELREKRAKLHQLLDEAEANGSTLTAEQIKACRWWASNDQLTLDRCESYIKSTEKALKAPAV